MHCPRSRFTSVRVRRFLLGDARFTFTSDHDRITRVRMSSRVTYAEAYPCKRWALPSVLPTTVTPTRFLPRLVAGRVEDMAWGASSGRGRLGSSEE